MKKILISTFAVTLLSTTAFASSNKYYMGLGANFSISAEHSQDRDIDYDSTADTTSSINTDLDSGNGASIKVGVDQGAFRFEMGYSSIRFDDKVSFSSDKSYKAQFNGFDFSLIQSIGDKSLKPYVSFGLSVYSWDNLKVKREGSDDSTNRIGLGFNYGAGLLYSLGSFEFDIAYKGKYLKWEEIEGRFSNADVKYEDDTRLGGFYTGINYLF